jgi:hypothetical protein
MKNATATIFAVLLSGSFPAVAQKIHDPPWNSEHIDRLPPEVRNAVLARCATIPSAGHYFATYGPDRLTLHFEHFHCDHVAEAYCKGAQCLHQVYRLSGGHYSLVKTGYGSENE